MIPHCDIHKKVGLYNLEPFVVNTAMMRVSRYHKDQGDEVEEYNHFYPEDYDVVYAFSLFNYTPKGYITSKMICGGTGFDLTTTLPPEIDGSDYDWSLYPRCNYSMVWFSKGCIRNCPFCIVRLKEGCIQPCEPKNLNPNGVEIKIQDNNFFASLEWREAIKQLKEWDQPCDFAGGIDIRLMDEETCNALNGLRYGKHPKIKMAWDNPKDDLIWKFQEVVKIIKPYKIMVYVLIGYWSDEDQDVMRVEKLREIGIDPFVMPFNKRDHYQRSFARYVNHKAVFKSCTWSEYKKRKGLK